VAAWVAAGGTPYELAWSRGACIVAAHSVCLFVVSVSSNFLSNFAAADVDICNLSNALEILSETEKQIKDNKKPIYMAYCCTVTV
jgi:hypothetical protein